MKKINVLASVALFAAIICFIVPAHADEEDYIGTWYIQGFADPSQPDMATSSIMATFGKGEDGLTLLYDSVQSRKIFPSVFGSSFTPGYGTCKEQADGTLRCVSLVGALDPGTDFPVGHARIVITLDEIDDDNENEATGTFGPLFMVGCSDPPICAQVVPLTGGIDLFGGATIPVKGFRLQP